MAAGIVDKHSVTAHHSVNRAVSAPVFVHEKPPTWPPSGGLLYSAHSVTDAVPIYPLEYLKMKTIISLLVITLLATLTNNIIRSVSHAKDTRLSAIE